MACWSRSVLSAAETLLNQRPERRSRKPAPSSWTRTSAPATAVRRSKAGVTTSSLRDDDDIASALPGVLAEQVGQRFGEGLHVLAQIGDDGAVLSAVDHGMGPGET